MLKLFFYSVVDFSVLFFLTIVTSVYIEKNYGDDYTTAFSNNYITEEWGGGKGSGTGSNPANAEPYIALLQKYFDDARFKTIVDLGNGDWQIMQKIKIPDGIIYKGYDVVRSIQATNRVRFSRDNVKFYDINNLRQLKEQKVSGDLLVVKDVIQHWPIEEINYFIEKILPNFKYALITNSITEDAPGTAFPINSDIHLGGFRPILLRAPPFNLKNVRVLLEYPSPGMKQVLLYENPTNK